MHSVIIGVRESNRRHPRLPSLRSYAKLGFFHVVRIRKVVHSPNCIDHLWSPLQPLRFLLRVVNLLQRHYFDCVTIIHTKSLDSHTSILLEHYFRRRKTGWHRGFLYSKSLSSIWPYSLLVYRPCFLTRFFEGHVPRSWHHDDARTP